MCSAIVCQCTCGFLLLFILSGFNHISFYVTYICPLSSSKIICIYYCRISEADQQFKMVSQMRLEDVCHAQLQSLFTMP